VIIKTPEQYINRPEILKSAGSYVAEYGKKILVIAGKTALAVAGKDLLTSFKAARLEFGVEEFQGYCTANAVAHYASVVKENQADAVMGVGGGKVLDLAKAAADKSGVPAITVPTIAATCAAWSALSIIYDKDGRYSGGLILKASPKLVLADTRIIAVAPLRYLRAGMADTLAKFYEMAPHASRAGGDVTLKLGLHNAELAFNILSRNGARAIQEIETGNSNGVFPEVVDAIIVLAGLVGSITEGTYRPALGHAIHNSLTYFPETHESLHGEKVIFGVFAQLILEGKTPQAITEFLNCINELGLPVTLHQIGIQNDADTISEIARNVKIKAEALNKYAFPVTTRSLAEAIARANELGEASLNRGGIIIDEQRVVTGRSC
jgi:Glycerol dehydrogenase and related enzymes